MLVAGSGTETCEEEGEEFISPTAADLGLDSKSSRAPPSFSFGDGTSRARSDLRSVLCVTGHPGVVYEVGLVY